MQQKLKSNRHDLTTIKINKIDLSSEVEKITQTVNCKKHLHWEFRLKKKAKRNILKEILKNDVNKILDIYEWFWNL